MGVMSTFLPVLRATGSISDMTNPAKWFSDAVVGRITTAGVRVSPTTSVGLAAYYACLRNIAEDVAKVPFKLYERLEPRGKRVVSDHAVYDLLQNDWNDETPAQVGRETITSWAAGWGGGFAHILSDNGGYPRELWVIHPSRVTPLRNAAGEYGYQVKTTANKLDKKLPGTAIWNWVWIPFREMLHIHGLGDDGLTGYSVAQLAAATIGLGLAQEAFAGSYFGNGVHLGMVVKHPQSLKEVARANLKRSLHEELGGPDKAHGTLLLEEGMELQGVPTSIPPKDAMLIEGMNANTETVARWFRMPLNKIQYRQAAQGWSSVEGENTAYVGDCLMPWYRRWEVEVCRKLLTREERKRLFAEHLILGLLRGDSAARSAYYRERLFIGTLSQNDIRELENENPIDDPAANLYWMQVAMAPIGRIATGQVAAGGAINLPARQDQVAPAPIRAPADEEVTTTEDAAAATFASGTDGVFTTIIATTPPAASVTASAPCINAEVLAPVFLDAAWRVIKKEPAAVSKACKKFAVAGGLEGFDSWALEFFADQEGYFLEVFTPPHAAVAAMHGCAATVHAAVATTRAASDYARDGRVRACAMFKSGGTSDEAESWPENLAKLWSSRVLAASIQACREATL